MNATINVARDFSRFPGGRTIKDGPCSGEHFRHDFLVPSLQHAHKTIVELDGVRGYASSFLEEAFGGLVRMGFTKDELKDKLQVKASDSSLVIEIFDYIDKAQPAELSHA